MITHTSSIREQEPLSVASAANYYEAILMRLGDYQHESKTALRTIGVTSSNPREGVSTVAANLALQAANTLAHPVVLVEITTRATSFVSGAFHVPRSPGLTDVLHGHATLADCIHGTAITNLSVLPPGTPGNCEGVYQPRSLINLLRDLCDRFQFAVVDLPATDELSPALAVASKLDGVLLVVQAERTQSPAALRATQLLRRTGARLLGAVFNQQPPGRL